MIRKSTRRTFCFNSLSIRNLRARFAVAHAIALYTAERLYAFFSLFLHVSAPYLRLFPARPAFKFCRFALSIRSGYERTCAQTPNFRVFFTRRCARILSKFYVKFQACPHLHSRRRHKRSLLRARTKYLHDTAREMKFKRRLVKACLSRYSAPQNFKNGSEPRFKFIRGSAP